MIRRTCLPLLIALALGFAGPSKAQAACCYFSAQNADILQPAQKVFITWDPVKQQESFTVQPKFEGNALDFGMVIPTPTQPKLHEMPRDFFRHLAIYTILKSREFPESNLLYMNEEEEEESEQEVRRQPTVVVLEEGVVGSLDYKIIEASRAADLYKWLKDNRYSFAGDEAALNHYVQKKWIFTVMKIDTMQMKKIQDGSFAGDVTPTRFSFSSDKLIYPLKITQISVKDSTEALFYVQAPHKVDLPGDMSYQHTWIPMLQAASGCTPGGLPGKAGDWLARIDSLIPRFLLRGQELGFDFQPGQRPLPNKQGRTPTTLEWARRLTVEDIDILRGNAPYSETVPDVDEGFTAHDYANEDYAQAINQVILARLAKCHKERPQGYLVREVPVEDIQALQQLLGHLQAGQFITKFRKIFTRAEMDEDLLLVPARMGQEEDTSEYEEILPSSPP
jgi:hypothetical protein